jgi:hypothetical protein
MGLRDVPILLLSFGFFVLFCCVFGLAVCDIDGGIHSGEKAVSSQKRREIDGINVA